MYYTLRRALPALGPPLQSIWKNRLDRIQSYCLYIWKNGWKPLINTRPMQNMDVFYHSLSAKSKLQSAPSSIVSESVQRFSVATTDWSRNWAAQSHEPRKCLRSTENTLSFSSTVTRIHLSNNQCSRIGTCCVFTCLFRDANVSTLSRSTNRYYASYSRERTNAL